MPSLGSDMEAGTLVEWEKNPGDTVSRGDVVAVVETQKGAIEIEAFENGILTKQLIEIGTEVPVGTPMAIIDSATSSATPIAALDSKTSSATLDTVIAAESLGEERRRITPAARACAEKADLDTNTITGTGPYAAVVLDDVLNVTRVHDEVIGPDPRQQVKEQHPVVEESSSAIIKDLDKVLPEPIQAMAAMRAAISAAMTRSKKEIPHYYLAHAINISAAIAWLEDINAKRDPSQRLLLGVLLLKAVAMACKKYDEFNGHYLNDFLQASDTVHVGMAINLRGGGLVAPAIHNTHELDIDQLMARMRDLVERVRAGRFRAAELSDPTITVSSLGDRGVNSLLGVVYPPQVAIVGFGTPSLRALVGDDGDIHVGTVIDVTLAADHRVSDGHRGALFLRFIQKQLEHPEELTS